MSNISFDPNSLFKERVVDQSDLTTFVDLTVSLPERCITSFGKSKYENIMRGSLTENDNAFTTNYVDIVLQEGGYINNYAKDTFGITSIDIEFNASFHPVVTIKFVDIKGGNLFHGNENDRSAVFFNSLFHFPYPKFVLTVKGYYGKPVNFNIKVSDFDAEFESATGNYNVTVKFIGDIYGFLTDIPMSFLMLAPYSAITKENKSKFTESPEWIKFANEMEGAIGFKCPALIELYKKVKNLSGLGFSEKEKLILKNAFGYNNLNEEYVKLKKFLTTEKIQTVNELLIDIQNNINNNNGKYKSPYFANGFEVKSTEDDKYYIIYANDILDGDTLYKYKEFIKEKNAIILQDFGDPKITNDFVKIFGEFDILDTKSALIKASCNDNKIEELPKDFYYGEGPDELARGVYDFLDYMVDKEPTSYAKYNYNKDVYRIIIKPNDNTYQIGFSDQQITEKNKSRRKKGVVFKKEDEVYKNFNDSKYNCVNSLYGVNGGYYDSVAYFLQGATTISGSTLFYKKYEDGVVGIDGTITIDKGKSPSEQESDAKIILGNIVNYIKKRHEKIDEIKRYIEKRQIVVIPKTVNLSKDLNKILEHAKTKVETEEIRLKQQSKEILNIFKTKFGFLPTINNISKIVFMHFLFFSRYLVNSVKRAILEINSGKRNYKKTWSIVTDFDNMLDSNGEGKIPPYPLISMKGYSFHDEKTTEYPTKVFPKLISNFPDIAECRFVDIFYRLITVYQIENIENNNKNNSNNNNNNNFTLALPHDIFFERNPYIPEEGADDDFGNVKQYICDILARRLLAHCEYNALEGQTNNAMFIETEWENFIKPAIQTMNNSLVKQMFTTTDSLKAEINPRMDVLRNDYKYIPTKKVPFIYNAKGTMTKAFEKAYVVDSGDINGYEYEDTLKVNLYDSDGVKKEYTIDIDGKTIVEYLNEAEDVNLNKTEVINRKYAILGYFLLFSAKANDLSIDKNLFKEEDNGEIKFNWGGASICRTSYFWLLRCGAYYYFSSEELNLGIPNPFKKGSTNDYDLNLSEEEQKELIEAFKKWATEDNDITIGGEPICSLKKMYEIKDNKISKKIAPNFKGSQKDPLLKRIYVYMFPKNVREKNECGNPMSEHFKVIVKGIGDLNLSNQQAIAGAIQKSTGYINEVKTAMYYSLKHIVDNYIHEINDINNRRKEQTSIIFEVNTYDSYMNDIGETSFVDMNITGDIILEALKTSPSMSIMQFLALIAERNNYLCIMAPLRHVDGTKDGWKNVFEPKTVMENRYEVSNTILFYKNNEDSFQSENGRFDNDTLENAELTGIHPFVVSFGDTSNAIFKGISMNMGGSISTEESIANTLILAGDGSQEARKSINLYDIYKERSYKVSIDMMGNPNITPMMFFDLKNVPIYNGIYRIINVSHSITPNDFTTRVTGVKVSKYAKGESGGAGILYNLFSSLASNIDDIGAQSSSEKQTQSSGEGQDCDTRQLTSPSSKNNNAIYFDKTDNHYATHQALANNMISFIKEHNGGLQCPEKTFEDFFHGPQKWRYLKYAMVNPAANGHKRFWFTQTINVNGTVKTMSGLNRDCSTFVQMFYKLLLDKDVIAPTPNQFNMCSEKFEMVEESEFKKDVDSRGNHNVEELSNVLRQEGKDFDIYKGSQDRLLDNLKPGDIVFFSRLNYFYGGQKDFDNICYSRRGVYCIGHVEMYAGKMNGEHYYFGMRSGYRKKCGQKDCGFIKASHFDSRNKVFIAAFRLKS